MEEVGFLRMSRVLWAIRQGGHSGRYNGMSEAWKWNEGGTQGGISGIMRSWAYTGEQWKGEAST